MEPLRGINWAAWGVKLLLMTISAYQVNFSCFCALLRTQHCSLSPSVRPPPIYFIPDIAGVVETITKTSSVSYVTELVIKL